MEDKRKILIVTGAKPEELNGKYSPDEHVERWTNDDGAHIDITTKSDDMTDKKYYLWTMSNIRWKPYYELSGSDWTDKNSADKNPPLYKAWEISRWNPVLPSDTSEPEVVGHEVVPSKGGQGGGKLKRTKRTKRTKRSSKKKKKSKRIKRKNKSRRRK